MPDTTAAPASSRDHVERLLDRIETVDVHTNAICTLNPDVLAQAEARDAETKDGRSRGSLHGLPILVKDNVDTADLPTTAGSLALAEVPNPAQDADPRPPAARRRDGGAGQDQPERVGQHP